MVRLLRKGVVAELVLARPPGNRISLDALRRLEEAVVMLSQAPPRAVLLHAEGSDFCHGADLTDPELASALRDDQGREVARLGRALVDGWAALPCPTVVAARGRVVGAGACLFVGADFAVAAPNTSVCFPEVDRALHLSWGAVGRLVATWGLPAARQLALLGRTITVEGLAGVELADEPEVTARTLAAELAAKAPVAVRGIKGALADAVEGTVGVTGAHRDRDVARFAASVASPDFAEAMTAFFEGRVPIYRGESPTSG